MEQMLSPSPSEGILRILNKTVNQIYAPEDLACHKLSQKLHNVGIILSNSTVNLLVMMQWLLSDLPCFVDCKRGAEGKGGGKRINQDVMKP
jgi:hypothetical protein